MKLRTLYECASTYLNFFPEKPKVDFSQKSQKTNIVQKISTDNRTNKSSYDWPSKQQKNMMSASSCSTDSTSSHESAFEQTLQDVIFNNYTKK